MPFSGSAHGLSECLAKFDLGPLTTKKVTVGVEELLVALQWVSDGLTVTLVRGTGM